MAMRKHCVVTSARYRPDALTDRRHCVRLSGTFRDKQDEPQGFGYHGLGGRWFKSNPIRLGPVAQPAERLKYRSRHCVRPALPPPMAFVPRSRGAPAQLPRCLIFDPGASP
jgi:hypothetical protein